MMEIAFLGATSQIARDLIRIMAPDDRYALRLFSRRPEELQDWLKAEAIVGNVSSLPYGKFDDGNFDAIINFVGSGDPARTAVMGSTIFDVTSKFDSLALDYLHKHRTCRYLFLSSGAAYGSVFQVPAELRTNAVFPINALSASEFYSIAKIHAECRHRAMSEAAIIDIRVFSYCSARNDINARFLTSDILRSIHKNEVLRVSAETMHRDFITPVDFSELVKCILNAPISNRAIDSYSLSPVEKFQLLDRLRDVFDFQYEIVQATDIVYSTGKKNLYYSKNKIAAQFGYEPKYSSLEGVMRETRMALKMLAT